MAANPIIRIDIHNYRIDIYEYRANNLVLRIRYYVCIMQYSIAISVLIFYSAVRHSKPDVGAGPKKECVQKDYRVRCFAIVKKCLTYQVWCHRRAVYTL